MADNLEAAVSHEEPETAPTEQYVSNNFVALIFDQPSNLHQIYCARQEYTASAGEACICLEHLSMTFARLHFCSVLC